ncbi:Bifunctional dethiobiotin synthetase/7,8-diamino-pelargonic acid aminotransferase, mitochondrial [Ancistrocladus abbreviatus]
MLASSIYGNKCRPLPSSKSLSLLLYHRLLSSQPLPQPPPQAAPSNPVEIPLSHPIYTIWGSNTGVGKTLVSAGIASSIISSSATDDAKFTYIKPVQTGFPSDSDSRFVYRKVSEIFLWRRAPGSLLASNHIENASILAAKGVLGSVERGDGGLRDLSWYEERRLEGEVILGASVRRELMCKTLCAWSEAVSPHLAAERENGVMEDVGLLGMVQRSLWMGVNGVADKKDTTWSIIETAGGVASPGPSGSLQCDLYRPFRLPAILIGDGRLGGISGTISAYESLKLRGYDVVAIVLEDHGLANEGSLATYLHHSMPVLVLPPIPQNLSDDLMQWFDESNEIFSSLKEIMLSTFLGRVQRLHDMSKKAGDVFWWPFTQHHFVAEETVTVIDSRCGENFAVHKVQNQDLISQQFDACASWWTQGPDSTLQIELARDMGYAAARYGHVMFPENVYEPALTCAELLLDGVGKGWASRAFFSDNGSTAIEIALKMAFRKFAADQGIILDFLKSDKAEAPCELRVLALRGSYHGDTLGAMEAQAASSYTGFLQQPWYTGRGLFIDPPTVYMHDGKWKLLLPEGLPQEQYKLEDLTFQLRDELFCKSRDGSNLSGNYLSYISKQLSPSGLEENIHLGALILEPVIHGAGGMQMIDPLFQRMLVKECRSRKIPVIFDEVFTGFWRLGVESAAELLDCSPDIACFAKLLTGGIIPLSATLATEAVFEAFMGDSKLKALLHGHSYSGHAMGCTAASRAIRWFKDPMRNRNIIFEGKLLRELWDMELVRKISSNPVVKRLVVLGTVFALELQAEGSNAGYASLYANTLVKELLQDGIYTRPLGNVLYFMCSPCTSPVVCTQLLVKLCRRIEDFHQKNTRSF